MGVLAPKTEEEGPPPNSEDLVRPTMASDGEAKPRRKGLPFYMSIAALGLLSLITSWDATSLAIALPTITHQLNGSTLLSFWANVSFTLGVAITQPIYLTVSDVLGRKQPLYASMALFLAGTLVFATARTMTTVVVGRLIQGLGAGGLDILEEIILADITTLKERPLYLGILAIAIALGTITGPIVGALFTELVDWRWIGWVNLPIVGVAFVLSVVFLNLKPIPVPFMTKVRRLDWLGILLYGAGAAATSLPLSWAGSLYSWGSWRTLLPFFIGLLLLAGFVVYERRPAEAVMPYRIFSTPTATFSLVTGFLHGLILYSILQYLPLFFQAVFLETPLRAGISCLPLAVSVVFASAIGPLVVENIRRYKHILWFGWATRCVPPVRGARRTRHMLDRIRLSISEP